MMFLNLHHPRKKTKHCSMNNRVLFFIAYSALHYVFWMSMMETWQQSVSLSIKPGMIQPWIHWRRSNTRGRFLFGLSCLNKCERNSRTLMWDKANEPRLERWSPWRKCHSKVVSMVLCSVVYMYTQCFWCFHAQTYSRSVLLCAGMG